MRTPPRGGAVGRGVAWSALLLFAVGCAAPTLPESGPSVAVGDDLLIVDCLLPGRIRRLGAKTVFQTPRRPAKLSAWECGLRGGEYTARDRADLATSLSVWLFEAEAGDALAQTYVGEMYEKGLGTTPDLGEAERWYRLAAAQGFARAQVNLAHLLETDGASDRDRREAARWYEAAAALEEDVDTLEDVLAEQDRQVLALEAEIERLREAVREARERSVPSAAVPPPPRPTVPDLAYGDYHALVIGNDAYVELPELRTAVSDARAVAQLLKAEYGFRVIRLEDATRYDILSALNRLRSELSVQDNLLIYYAGHGEIDRANARGHWLPVDAERDSTANWISNVAVTDILNAVPARHVLVVADSCYAGTLTRSSLAPLDAVKGEDERLAWMRAILAKRSRTALSSGGLQPVLDGVGGPHSVFAASLLEVLGQNGRVLGGQELHQAMTAAVTSAAAGARFDQTPEYAPIRYAGHEAGDFLFVPRRPARP